MWNDKKTSQSSNNSKDEDKKVKTDTYKDKKTYDKDNKNWDKDSTSASSSNSRGRDQERTDSRYKNESRGGDQKDYQRNQGEGRASKSYDFDGEKKSSQDYRMNEKNEPWTNDEFDRKVEKKKDEKDLWSDEKSKDQRDSKYHNKKGKSSGDYTHDEQGNKSNDNRNSYGNEKQSYSNDRRPYSNDKRPYSNDKRPYSNDKRPYSNDKRPYSNDKRPYSNDKRPYSNDKRPYSNDKRPYSNDKRPYSNDKRPDSKRPDSNDKRSDSNDKRPYSNDRRPYSNDRRSDSNDKRSDSNDKRSDSNDKQPYSSDKRSYSSDKRSYSNDKRSNSNDKRSYSNDGNTNKEPYSDRRDQKYSFKLKNERDEKVDYGDTKKAEQVASKTGENDRNNRNYSDKGKRDREMQQHKFERDCDSKYDKNSRGPSKDFPGKTQWKGERQDEQQYDGDKNEVRNVSKKPVAYDARSQNWFYDGEKKNEKDNSQCNDLVSISFKEEGKHGKKDAGQSRLPFRDSKSDYYSNDYRGDSGYAYNKKEQKNRYSKPNAQNFPDRDKNEERKEYQGKQQYNRSYDKGDYSKDNDYKNYYRDKDTSDYNRDNFQSRRQPSDDLHTSKGSKDNTGSTQRQKYIDKTSQDVKHFNVIEECNSNYSPGKRIPLEILFGKSPHAAEDKDIGKVNTTVSASETVSSNVTYEQADSYQPNTQSAKISSKEIMERSLEQNPNHFNPIQQEMLYMQFSDVNQLNQINPHYQQHYPIQNIQLPSTSQYMGYSTEHAGSGASAGAAVNPYLSYPSPNPRNNFQYNQMHTQHRALQQQLPQQQQLPPQQQTQGLQNDIPFYSSNGIYYPVNNPQITQVPEQY